MSAATGVTWTPTALWISSAAASMLVQGRATMVNSTPSRARDMAQAFPSPMLAPPTIAFFPAIPKSIYVSPCYYLRLAMIDAFF